MSERLHLTSSRHQIEQEEINEENIENLECNTMHPKILASIVPNRHELTNKEAPN
jgi:hypothetical protein